jgi:hypothetical protein
MSYKKHVEEKLNLCEKEVGSMPDSDPLLRIIKRFCKVTTQELLENWQENHSGAEKIKYNLLLSVDIDGQSYSYNSRGTTDKLKRGG